MEDEAEQFDLSCPNLATEDTYGDVGEVAAAKCFVAGVVEG